MVGGALDGFDTLGVGLGKIPRQRVECTQCISRKGGHFGNQRLGGERLEPFSFYNDAVVNQAEFTEMGAQAFDFGGIAAIQRRQGSEGGEAHGRFPAGKSTILPEKRCAARLNPEVHGQDQQDFAG